MSAIAVAEPKTLYAICDDLQTYTDTLETIEAQLSGPIDADERAILEAGRGEMLAAIERIGAALAGKTDSIACVLRRMRTEVCALEDEEKRLRARRKSFERADDWLCAYVTATLKRQGVSILKTPANTLSLRSTDSVEIVDASKVPAEYQNAEVKMPLSLWLDAIEMARLHIGGEFAEKLNTLRVKAEPSASTIKKAIKSGVDVPGADLKFGDCLVLR